MTVNEAIQRAMALFDGGLQETSLRPRYPGLAVELTPRRITAVRVARDRKKSGYVLRETLTRDFPEGAIEPSLTGLNIRQPEPVSATIREVLDKVGGGAH